VLAAGLLLGFMNIPSIPAIILAQALNGLILPFVSIFLIFVINDPKLMGKDGMNSWLSNVVMGIVVWITLILGINSIFKAISRTFKLDLPQDGNSIWIIAGVTLLASISILIRIYFIRKKV